MKALFFAIFTLLLASVGSFAQGTPIFRPATTPSTTTQPPTGSKDESSNIILTPEEQAVITKLEGLRAAAGVCQWVKDDADECARLANDYYVVFSKIAASPNLTFWALGNSANRFEINRNRAKSAPQISQVADEQNIVLTQLMIAQNQRIIELLEQLVKKK